ncbi:peptidylprolyl isomerase [Gammaproteobacteria bacterium]|nr:peptidylprolyl isomerase [Gammaproteobacteria bacterium]
MNTSLKTLIIALSLAGFGQLSNAQEQAVATAIVIPDPVATMNGIPLSKASFDKFISFIETQTGQPAPTDLEEIKAIINEYAIQFLLAEDAKKEGLDKTEIFLAQKEIIELSLLANAGLTAKIKAIEISTADVEAEYNKRVEGIAGTEYKAAHILVDTEEQAKEIIEKLDKKEITFAEAAKESKDTGSAQDGGNLGWFKKGMMVDTFFDAVAALKSGEITQNPVKSEFGFHIILLEESREQIKPTLASLKDDITDGLRNSRANELLEKFKEEVKIEFLVK